ncbi:MAG: GGDEF domain-containing protein [Thermodesulfobacteriota bacterium]|jgi:diguanylate cyclase (GGDEF)-like protein
MNTNTFGNKISWWSSEFLDPEMERSFQKHVQPTITRQLKIVLMIWGALLLLFALPDYTALGPTRPFYYLLAYRVIIAVMLLMMFFKITPNTAIFKISYPITLIAIAGFSGFMLLFVFRPDIVNWIIGVIMIQLIGMLMFIPIRFPLSFLAALYGLVITMVTRWVMGTTKENLIGLFFLLMLPVVTGAATTIRLAIIQRRQYVSLKKAEKLNLELQNEMDQRLKLEKVLKELAATDPLTGLFNRREYEMLFKHEIERARRMKTSLSLGILDLDYFKKVNDTYGHGVGDEVLRRTAELLRKNLRAVEIIGRFGGEEFIIFFPDTSIDQAVMISDRFLKKLSATDINIGVSTIRITATAGITQLLPIDKDINSIIRRADTALYKGKEAGRNRVETSMDDLQHIADGKISQQYGIMKT